MRVLRLCNICNARNLLNTRPLITPIRAYFIGERLIFDLIDLRHYSKQNSGYKWLLVGLDSFSKFAWTFALKTKTADEVVKSIEIVFLTFKPPLILHTDNGREFVNQKMRDLCSKHDVRHVRGRARCPWVQGQVERLNQTLKFMISSRCYSDNLNFSWSCIHLEITYWYNQMIHGTTRFTPSQLLYGT
ncbi:Gag-Pol polyprotein, partial [Dictyocoela muelleri]